MNRLETVGAIAQQADRVQAQASASAHKIDPVFAAVRGSEHRPAGLDDDALAALQLEQGDTKGAVASLETGTKVSPEADYIHYQLAMAYRRDSREEDAQREIKLYQTLKNRQRGRGNVPQSD